MNLLANVIWNAQRIFLSAFDNFIELYLWKVIESLSIILTWIILSYLLYRVIIYSFHKLSIIELIDRIEKKMSAEVKDDIGAKEAKKSQTKEKDSLTKKFKIDQIVARAVSYYVFLLFFRIAITLYWINDVEAFMDELLRYLPKLFIWAVIWYFWFRFAKFIHDIVLYAFGTKNKDTSKIVASGIRGIIIFFTIMAVLDQVGIATEITTTILNGFIAMLAIAGWLAFWLGWKDVAKEILESFRK